LRLELEPEQLDARSDRLTGERARTSATACGTSPSSSKNDLPSTFRPHAERVQSLSFGEREDTLRIEREQNDR